MHPFLVCYFITWTLYCVSVVYLTITATKAEMISVLTSQSCKTHLLSSVFVADRPLNSFDLLLKLASLDCISLSRLHQHSRLALFYGWAYLTQYLISHHIEFGVLYCSKRISVSSLWLLTLHYTVDQLHDDSVLGLVNEQSCLKSGCSANVAEIKAKSRALFWLQTHFFPCADNL